jgi:penicillin V acylase-like amidase (Ntn superfamily)
MKKLFITLFLFSSIFMLGQVVPQGINYQAVALDQQGQPIPGVDIVGRPIDDAEIGVRISILEASPTGNVLYQEEHEVLTDQYGMFNLTIGQGLQVSADAFNTINWQGDKFLQVELSIENDGEFTLSAVQQLMSVPYAFLADRALNVDDADSDPTNELQALSISNDTLYLSSGGYVVLPTDQLNDADADPTNELQVISMSNDTLYLSSGGFVVLPPDQINDADADPTNEFQTITRNGSTINLSGNGGSVTVFDGDYTNLTNTPSIPSKTSDLVNDSGFLTSEVDGSTTNEIQTLSKSGSTISLSDNGGSVTVFDGDYNNLSNTPSIPTSTSDLTNDSGFLTSEVDGSTTNEIQTLSKSGSTISLSDNGGSVTVFDGDYNNLSNTPSIPTNTSDLTNDSGFLTSEVDGSTTNEIQILSISNDTIFLSGGGFIKLPASQGFDGDYNSLTNTPSIPTLTSDLTNDSGFLTSEVDGSTTNEIQMLSKSGTTISLSNNGGSVTVFDGDYNNLSNTPTIPSKTSDLTNDSGFITTEQDSSVTNELQTLSISNDTLFLSNGGFIKLPNSSSTVGSTVGGGLYYRTSSHHAHLSSASSVVAWGNLDGSVETSIFTNVAIPNYYSVSGQSPLRMKIIGYRNSTKVVLQAVYEIAHSGNDNTIIYSGNTENEISLLSNSGGRNFYFIAHTYNENGIDSLRLEISQVQNNQNDQVSIKSTLKTPSVRSINSVSSNNSTTPIDTVVPVNPISGQFWYDYENGQLKSYLNTPSSSKYFRLGQNMIQSSMGTNVSGSWTIYRLTSTQDIYSWGALEGDYTSSLSSSCSGEIKVYLDQDTLFTNGFGNEHFSRSSTPVLGGQTLSDLTTFSGLIEENTVIWIIVKHHSCGNQYAIQNFSQSIPTEFKDVNVFQSYYDPLVYYATNGFITAATRFPRVSFSYKNISLKWNVIKDFNETF